jgi:signal transduction histidine kinase/ligand-binding sensor domain-containing protein
MMRFVLVIQLALFALHTTARQSPFLQTDLLSQAAVFAWTGENGLISNNITSSLQAKSGFIWITTYNGIMRFDGRRVDVYDRSTLPFLTTDAFYRIFQDARGTLWFASQGSGIVIYDGKNFRPVTASNGEIPKSVRSLYFDDTGDVWIGSNNEGLLRLSKNTITKIHHPALDNITVLDIDKDKQNNLWLATDGNGVICYDGKNFKHITDSDGLPSNSINTLKVVEDEIFIGTTNGLVRLKNNQLTAVNLLNNVPINDIVKGPDGLLWIASENGMARISNSIQEFVSDKTKPAFNRINSISFDNEGSAWISTGRNGLLQVKQTGVINFTTAQGLSLNRVNIIAEGPNRSFYIGSDGGDIDEYKNGEVRSIPIKSPLASAGIRDICMDDEQNMWIASYRGILKKSTSGEKFYGLADGLPAIDMRRILKDKNGHLWFASRSGGVAKFVNEKVVAVYNKDNGLGSNYVMSLEEDARGNIYVGTHSGGLTMITPDGKTKLFHIHDNDAGILIFNIHIANDGTIWLICNSGIYYFDGLTFKTLNLDGLTKGETFFDLLEDRNGNFWITANIGVLRLFRTNVDQFLQGQLTKVPIKLFDNQDGMINKECTGATRSLASSSGRLWIPTIGGVVVFYPEKIIENKIIPPVFITSLVTDNNTATYDSSKVPPGNLRYTFHYTALSYWSPSKVRFKHKLEGVDPDWVESGTVRQVEYTNLKPGRYNFSVIACNNDGIWNTQGATMHFNVQPFFYQTIIFKAITIIGITFLLFGAYKWRVHRVEKRNAELRKLNSELDRFVYSTSHDLRAPLSSILGLINLSRMEQGNRELYLSMIEKSIHKLDEFIKEIIDYSRNARLEVHATEINFEEMVNSIVEDLVFMESTITIKKNIHITGNVPFNSDKTRVKIILSNLISNAIKYCDTTKAEPRVNINITHNSQQADIVISDNGIGIPPDQHADIFKMFYRGSELSKGSGLGLYIVKETIEKLGGTITVESEVGRGTSFEVKIPQLTS